LFYNSLDFKTRLSISSQCCIICDAREALKDLDTTLII